MGHWLEIPILNNWIKVATDRQSSPVPSLCMKGVYSAGLAAKNDATYAKGSVDFVIIVHLTTPLSSKALIIGIPPFRVIFLGSLFHPLITPLHCFDTVPMKFWFVGLIFQSTPKKMHSSSENDNHIMLDTIQYKIHMI